MSEAVDRAISAAHLALDKFNEDGPPTTNTGLVLRAIIPPALAAATAWQPLDTAPKPQPGATWGPKFLVGREGMIESIGIGQFQSCILEPQSFVLEVAGNHLRAHDDLLFTHWAPLPDGPQSICIQNTGRSEDYK